jgi:hypothetical protein
VTPVPVGSTMRGARNTADEIVREGTNDQSVNATVRTSMRLMSAVVVEIFERQLYRCGSSMPND